ncbi:MAG: DUF72 domain-containing protein [Kiritimatiellae bacterium]|nr:DUF72 domain-containing protein [Kiritimatiellia bacterium]
MAQISVGVAGWAYPDWEGYVYPPGMPDRERLRYIASFVDVVEINSTFYRPPSHRTVLGWYQQTADLGDFFFTAKIHQNVTHGGLIESEVVDAFHSAFAPMAKAQKLRHLLAQFPYDFSDSPKARNHLREIVRTFGDLAEVTFELRHNSWQAPAALEYLSSLGANVATLDYPTARSSFNLRICLVGKHRYFRLHGRNTRAWFDRQAGRDERYDYCYSEKEIEDIVKRATELARSSRTLTIIANNHYRGKEVVNALQIKAAITGLRIPVPPHLKQNYPQLERVAT